MVGNKIRTAIHLNTAKVIKILPLFEENNIFNFFIYKVTTI